MPKQKTDIFAYDSNALFFAKPGLTWTIKPGVYLASAIETVISVLADSTLVNQGTLYSPEAAVYFRGDNAKVVNAKDALIQGEVIAVVFDYVETFADKGVLQNRGDIISFTGVGVEMAGYYDFKTVNDGKIFGQNMAIALDLTDIGDRGPKIVNKGVTESEGTAIASVFGTGSTVTIVNKPGAEIEGPTAAISLEAARLDLENDGKIKGDVITSTAWVTDKVVNSGKIKGNVDLGGGNDTVKNKDGKVTGLLYGKDGNDKFVLGDTAEKLVFDTALNAITNVDRIKNFETGADQLILDMSFFTELPGTGELPGSAFHKGTEAADASDRIIYDKASGALYYDPTGSTFGSSDMVQFATLDAGAKLKASDFLVIA